MTETIFDIVDKGKSTIVSNSTATTSAFSKLIQSYLSETYSTSTQAFIKKIATKIQTKHATLLKYDFRKQLRQLCRKFLLTDLQLIFLTYFSNSNKWNFAHQVIVQNKGQMKFFPESNQSCSRQLKLYMYLMAYFVKSYIGDKQQLNVLTENYQNQIPYFLQIYQQWLDKNQKSQFIISPRQLNSIYTQFSRNTDRKTSKKDYNCMVDQILELSTTYSIMPSREEKKSKPKKYVQDLSKNSSSPNKRHKRSFQSGIFEFSPKCEINEMKLRNKSIIISGASQYQQKGSNINSISQPSIVSDPPKRTVTLKRKKHQDNQSQINNTVKNYFQNKNPSELIQEQRKNQNMRQMNPVPFFDMNIRSSGIQSLPFPGRSNSNIFGPSRLF